MVSETYDYLFLAVVLVGAVIALGIVALIVAALIKYLRGNPKEQLPPSSGAR